MKLESLRMITYLLAYQPTEIQDLNIVQNGQKKNRKKPGNLVATDHPEKIDLFVTIPAKNHVKYYTVILLVMIYQKLTFMPQIKIM